MEKLTQSRWKLLITLATFVVFAILIFSLRHQIGQAISNLGKVHAWALVLIIPLQALNYDAYARLYRGLFGILGSKVSYSYMYRLALELNFVNHILPSGGVSGISYFGVRTKSEHVSATKATFVQFMKFGLIYISFLPILVLGLFLLAARGHTNNFIILISSSIITAVIIGTFIVTYIVESRSRISSFLTFLTKILNGILHIVRPKKPETISIERAQRAFNELHDNYQLIKKSWKQLRMPFVYTTVVSLTEIASIYVVYVAFGEFVNFGAVILAYAVANFAGLISVLPAGIGVYEGLMTAVLAASGVPVALSIPVTIMYRICSMLVQLVPGYILYQRALRSGLVNKV